MELLSHFLKLKVYAVIVPVASIIRPINELIPYKFQCMAHLDTILQESILLPAESSDTINRL